MTRRQPTAAELQAMLFGWRVVKHVKSNAIVYCGPDRTLGVGAGQMSRVDSSRIAVWKAGEAGLSLKGSVVCSDAFFPFPDGLIAAGEAGATAAVQPGGSVRDAEVIAAADRTRHGDGIHRHAAFPALRIETHMVEGMGMCALPLISFTSCMGVAFYELPQRGRGETARASLVAFSPIGGEGWDEGGVANQPRPQ